jgi:type II secretory pathway predicted ATPase ExeA
MNYNNFFGFSDSPFVDVPDQRFLFLSQQYELFLAELSEFITSRQGIAVISGDDGVGKTMLAHALMQRLPQSFHPLIISRPTAESLAISLMIGQSLGIDLRERNLVTLTPLTEAIQAAAEQSKYLLVFLDDAHTLLDQHLEEIYNLSQIQHHGQQLMPIILMGRKGLIQKLACQANQRLDGLIRQDFSLSGLTFEETNRYIDHRLKQVGSSLTACFAEGCSGQLFARTGGIPRRINQVCDQALTRAWQENRPRVTRDLLGEKEPASPFKPLKPPPQWRFRKIHGALMVGVLVAGLMGYVFSSHYYTPDRKTSPSTDETTVAPAKTLVASPQEKSPPDSATVVHGQPQDQPAEKTARSQEYPPSFSQASRDPGSAQELTAADTPSVPQPSHQATDPKISEPGAHWVASEDGSLLEIVAAHYSDDKEIGYDAVILANPHLVKEDMVQKGQTLIFPHVDKHNKIITLSPQQHFALLHNFSHLSQVETTISRLKDRNLRFITRETLFPDNNRSYRIFLGGYESINDLKGAMALAQKN